MTARNDRTILRESIEIKIKGLSSLVDLQVGINSLEICFSIINLSLKCFDLSIPRIDEKNTTHIFEQIQNVEKICIIGDLYYFNLDNLVNLKRLYIRGNICDGFNFELFKNLSNQLDHLSIAIHNYDYDTFLKLINGCNFSNLQTLHIADTNIRRIEKKLIEKFPRLQNFRMTNCNLEIIEDDAFSSSENLILLDLRENLLKNLYKRLFSKLVNLKYFSMHKNRLESIENGMFSHMRNIKYIDVSYNQLVIRNLEPFRGKYLGTVDICIVNNSQ